VRSLFHSTPARRKFLRSARSETRAAIEVVRTLALARPDLAVSMLCDGKRIMDAAPAPSLAERVAQVLGRDLANTMVPVSHEHEGIAIAGLAQRPADALPSGRAVYLFVNGRPFRDHFLVRSGERGYRATIHPGARPSLILSITVPPADVDVNVHPAKLEVRFRDRYAIEAVVEDAVQRALGELAAAAVLGRTMTDEWGPGTETAKTDDRRPMTEDAGLFDGEASVIGHPSSVIEVPQVQPGLRVLCQLHDSFILVEGREALLIVDQHSAHERVLYERAMTVLESGGASSQQLLFPLTLRLGTAELDALEQHRELVEALGYEYQPFGGDSIAVHAAPAPHPRFDASRCFRELVAGQPLSRPEMDELIARLFSSTLPAHDVHGRPTVVQLPRHELERRFGRTLNR
jgi:DNA mismatch repair protein MutL